MNLLKIVFRFLSRFAFREFPIQNQAFALQKAQKIVGNAVLVADIQVPNDSCSNMWERPFFKQVLRNICYDFAAGGWGTECLVATIGPLQHHISDTAQLLKLLSETSFWAIFAEILTEPC